MKDFFKHLTKIIHKQITYFLKVKKVSRDVDTATILKQYRLLYKKHHPDRNRDNEKQATEKFQQLSEATDVLRDLQRRAIYDKYDLFDMVFKEDKENDNSCVLSRITMDLTLQDCYNGVKKITEFDYGYNCPLCSSGKHEMHYTKCSEKGIIKILIADDDKKSENELYEKKRTLPCCVCNGKCKIKRCIKTCSGKLTERVTVNLYFVMNKVK
ncbi:chaperone protein DnaJ [Reticulomyxa filosa]|uniref:Chaperone protein DnaJ n=1 Tax=Reticulomyxa filosa TaxID=46433 RepID=X6LQC2_RETFI|nr:chaperone protein DnaJ [Reticulomyxa filosa]|eukprot:ETO03596.1 chaperone protein DnaJ [Reticulomyxa filosa]